MVVHRKCCDPTTCNEQWTPDNGTDYQARFVMGNMSMDKNLQEEIWKDGVIIPLDGFPSGALPVSGGTYSLGLGSGPDTLGIGYYNLDSSAVRLDQFLSWPDQQVAVYTPDSKKAFDPGPDIEVPLIWGDNTLGPGCSRSRGNLAYQNITSQVYGYRSTAGVLLTNIVFDNVLFSNTGFWYYDTFITRDGVDNEGNACSVRIFYNASVGPSEVATDSIPYDGSFFANGQNYTIVGDEPWGSGDIPNAVPFWTTVGIANRYAGTPYIPSGGGFDVGSPGVNQFQGRQCNTDTYTETGNPYTSSVFNAGRVVREFLEFRQQALFAGGEDGATLTTGGTLQHQLHPQQEIYLGRILSPTGFNDTSQVAYSHATQMSYPPTGSSHLGAAAPLIRIGIPGFTTTLFCDLTQFGSTYTVTDNLKSCFYRSTATGSPSSYPEARNTPLAISTLGGSSRVYEPNVPSGGNARSFYLSGLSKREIPYASGSVTWNFEVDIHTSEVVPVPGESARQRLNFSSESGGGTIVLLANEPSGRWLYRDDPALREFIDWTDEDDFEVDLLPTPGFTYPNNIGGVVTSQRFYRENSGGIRVQGPGDRVTVGAIDFSADSTTSKVVREEA